MEITRHYKLSAKAIREVATILAHTHTKLGASAADKLERRFFQTFSDLAKYQALGHRRYDLTSENILFYKCEPYVILLRQTQSRAWILRVLHGARDIRKLI